MSNPTVEAVESALNLLEEGAGSLTFGSGMAAISTTLSCFLEAGDHVVRFEHWDSSTYLYSISGD